MTIGSITNIQFLIDNSVEEYTKLENKSSFAKAIPFVKHNSKNKQYRNTCLATKWGSRL